jgi:hypothetical protein
MKKFKSLWYTGLAIVGIPAVIVVIATFFAILNQTKTVIYPAEKTTTRKPKVDTVVVEKRVIVRDTVYIKPKIKPTPVTPVNDSL